MFEFLSILPGKKKLTTSGWYSLNAICCHHRGHRPDRRGRGGIKLESHEQTYHCFNCGFTAHFTLGKSIQKNTRDLLSWCGVEDIQIQKWNLESLQHKDLIEYTRIKREKTKIKFDEHKLPDGEIINAKNPSHKKYVDYLLKRALNPNSYPFLITPTAEGRLSNRIIIPYTYKNKIVGHTSRFLDARLPKYINEQQPGYVFGYDFQDPSWEVCIVVEGIFDALSINGCAVMHNTISEDQSNLLARLNRRIVFVPDMDKSGLEACDRALELGYSISIPNWDDGIKDVNDAVVKYGRFPTILSILQSATHSKIKMELKRRRLLGK